MRPSSCNPFSGWQVAWFAAGLLFATAASADAEAMNRVLRQPAQLEKFDVCWGGTCAGVVQTGLTRQEWQQVRKLFDPLPEHAEAERATIRTAIGLLERILGPKTGTAQDKAGTFGNSAWPGQLDCNDETANTTTYLRLMLADGLIHFHRILDTTTRGGFLIFGRHSTAAIQQTATGEKFAVDSWFFDNGHPAVIIPLETWADGWKPDNSAAR